MNSHVRNYYRNSGLSSLWECHFYEAIPLHEREEITWKQASDLVPSIPKIWHDICQLSKKDRIEAVFSLWMKQLSGSQENLNNLSTFFQNLDDVGVFLFNLGPDLPYETEMVYSLADESCFYHGMPPIALEDSLYLSGQFGGLLPKDYLSFLHVHNGFSKHTDTGVFRGQDILRMYRKLIRDISERGLLIKNRGHFIDHKDLIPFYESFGTKSYQCFLKEWHYGSDVGNVFFSLRDGSISDYQSFDSITNTLAFTTFFDWLNFYLEPIGEEWLL